MNNFIKQVIEEKFASKAQQRFFYAKANEKGSSKGEKKKWGKWAKEFSDKTNYDKIPDKVEKEEEEVDEIVDAQGNIVDGDAIMTILARGFKTRGALKSNTIVGTVMSNLGFMHAMKDAEIDVITTAVGDRYVLEKMLEGDFSLGGEQSGHLIMREFANTGDGILTALQLAQEVVRTSKPLAELASAMKRFPQVLITVPNVAKDKLSTSKVISDAVAEAEAKLADNGRVLLRASGTEPLVRVMVEASSDNLAQEIAATLAAVVKAELGS
jgi:phosphoglucosamine mutase